MRSLLDELEAHGAQTPAELPESLRDKLRVGLKLQYADTTEVLGRMAQAASEEESQTEGATRTETDSDGPS